MYEDSLLRIVEFLMFPIAYVIGAIDNVLMGFCDWIFIQKTPRPQIRTREEELLAENVALRAQNKQLLQQIGQRSEYR